MSRPGDAALSIRTRPVTCAGELMLRTAPVSWSRSNRITPPRPCSIARTIHELEPTCSPRNPITSRLAILDRSCASLIGVCVGDGVGLGDAVGDGVLGDGEPGAVTLSL